MTAARKLPDIVSDFKSRLEGNCAEFVGRMIRRCAESEPGIASAVDGNTGIASDCNEWKTSRFALAPGITAGYYEPVCECAKRRHQAV